MSDTAVFLAHAGIAALLALGILLLPIRAQGRRALSAIVVGGCLVLGLAWLAGVALLPVVPDAMKNPLRQLASGTVALGPWLVGMAMVATVDAARQRSQGAQAAARLAAALSVYIALNFFGFEIGKALHDAEMRQFFQASGYPVWSMYAVVAVETLSAFALLIPRLRPIAATVLALTMLGAIATHARNGDPFGDSLDALRMLLAAACVLLLTQRLKARGLFRG
ncbi:DoxX family protein [Dyella sp. LX-66]|uniref:DoxX family protein n=1 Tax=unclassified Dyella TaxID=2634549 RepID=UPI001BE092EB|nr:MULTISPECIES: DoxX family protein [unclassified Dyella]MBT2118386.1 DoxX family protein [Dyella sp. LX-1]MBT2140269.1 DoxX family protein [Dyella sp. LX-66]